MGVSVGVWGEVGVGELSSSFPSDGKLPSLPLSSGRSPLVYPGSPLLDGAVYVILWCLSKKNMLLKCEKKS